MAGLRMVVLGVGDAFSARHYSSSFALEAEGSWLLVDCAHPIRKILREGSASAGAALDIDSLIGVAVTHLHADHSSGLEGLGFYSRFRLERRARLLAHPEVSARLWEGQLLAGMGRAITQPGEAPVTRRLDDFFDIAPLSETQPTQIGPFAIECRRTLHSIPTTAFRIRTGGACLGYSADTAFDPTLLEWLGAADLVVHETSPGPMHTPYERLAALPSPLRGKLRLIHYPDDFDVEGSVIEPLRQGKSYVLS